ncbi:riboflavin kinase [Treponema socranskii subsp. socranskii VPI DR56BR1116 = ATCC 35536]|uniref:FAD synthase n=1 Tax=Treponema socranskii subsp. socranskii VPI DR56BR1116 = ATCC 35536 TaxID=1125725 RepID=U2L203_TRESO|nr:FAD synthetase family protein [Treponema socranskii]ERF59528.1 riboflavin kinase [Treponema socranskii subsp. socranskii VPI DR56BR1116 = ATCC 35536]ERJ98532.1 riboflavin kinase [Treponema socranskii subsp. socranskii VPI DR56BR1116 = ATCC 35536]
MIRFTWEEIESVIAGKRDVPDVFARGTALTVGNFDGPHIGHDSLFALVRAEAEKDGLTPGVVAFKQSLGAFKSEGFYEGDLSTLAQRLSVIEARGMAFAILIDFSDKFGKIEGRSFLSMLVHGCGMKFIAEGWDFRCGYRGAYGMKEIRAFSLESGIVSEFPEPTLYKGERVSSSLIRLRIFEGDIRSAEAMLGRKYVLDCSASVWKKDGCALTAERSAFAQVLPERGTYGVRVIADGYTAEARFTAESHILRLENLQKDVRHIKAVEFIRTIKE